MEKRINGFNAIILVTIMIVQLFGIDAIKAVAEELYLSEDTVIENDTDDSYYSSGAKVTVNNGVKVTGKIFGSGGSIENYGDIAQVDISASELHNYAGASVGSVDTYSTMNNIINDGKITTIDNLNGNVTNIGTIGSITINNSGIYNQPVVNMNGGTISSFISYIGKSDDGYAPKLILSGGNIDKIESMGMLDVDAVGSTTVGTFVGAVTLTGSGTISVTNTLNLSGDYSEVSPTLKVSDSTQINIADGSKVKVQYDGQDYLITEAGQGTLSDIVGNTISTNIEASETIDVSKSSGISRTKKYMPGQKITATYIVADGYYYPKDYAVTTDGSGTLSTDRIDAKTVSVSYIVENATNKIINITIPKASKRITQDAPVGLVGGVESVSGLTSDMEYADSPDSAAWTTCTDGTMDFTAGTWYFRYKETDEKYAGETSAVSVLERIETPAYIEAPSPAYHMSGTKGQNGYYISDIRLTAPEGYRISESENGTYRDSITINEQSELSFIYLMRVSDGLKTKAVGISDYAIDTTVPVVSVQNNQTYYGDTVEVSVYDKNLSQVYINGVLKQEDGVSRKLNFNSDNGICDYEIKAIDKAGNSKTVKIRVAAEWMRSGVVPKGKAVKLIPGNAYKLGDGTWKVSGDETAYNGNVTFYVDTEGSYMFDGQ